ncbi:PGF-pre-PGF domain-containing protein [Candidatus Pacearchaeota archaeon]|nr:PGF-pre-PGF domain-containing protein [Candidatus Pacearchaeota archaeon]
MKGRNLIFFSFVACVFLIIFIGFASAVQSVNITTPINSSNLSATAQDLKASILGIDGDSLVGNVSFYYQPWLYLNNGSWILITTVQNTTGNQSTFNATWDTTAVTDGKNYTINATAQNLQNGSNGTAIRGNITIDNTAPLTTAIGYTNGTFKKNTAQLTLNISVTDATVGLLNSSNAFCFVNVSGTSNQTIPLSGGWCNSSVLDLTGLGDGNRTIQIYVNDTLNNMRLNQTLVVFIDTTVPTATASCTPASPTDNGETVTCTCTGSDTGVGVNSSLTTEPSSTKTSSSSTGTFSYSCSITDNAGNSVSTTASYTVTGSGSSSGGGGGDSSQTSQSNTFTEIIPGVASIFKNFDEEVGLKEIQINVDNEAQNVKVTVTKYSGKPAAVSVEKSGKVYQYLQIDATNLEDKLDKAVVKVKVEKTWVSDNNLNKEDVSVFKFDETNSVWNELTTSYVEEDDTYYYYDTEVSSFSYFTISEKSTVSEEEEETTTTSTTPEAEEQEEKASNLWLWVIVVVIVALIIYAIMNRQK